MPHRSGPLESAMLRHAPSGIEIPAELRSLFRWVDARGASIEDGDGVVGDLWLPGEEAAGGTRILLVARSSQRQQVRLNAWFDRDLSSELQAWPFARTGADGSYALLWEDEGTTKIVHLPSGSGSELVCELGSAVDFLRLLAIGYEEICWPEEWSAAPDRANGHDPINLDFRSWVCRTFDVDLPATAAELLAVPPGWGVTDAPPHDRWDAKVHQLAGW